MQQAEIIIQTEGGSISAYQSRPEGTPRGGLILLQELFGVNHHIRHVADGYAADGYHVIAPALFDRAEKNVQLGYLEADMAKARELRATVSWDQALKDVEATRALFSATDKVGVLGFCWGGAIAWLAASKLDKLSAAVSYYGGGIGNFVSEIPGCPVLCHFGEKDHVIPLADVEKLKQAHPKDVEVHVYPAGHGFNCDERGSYDQESASLARTRTLEFLRRHIG
jgi:carboxymethylenebutenolidase